MTPELEAALAPIGWEAVKKISPEFAAQMSMILTPTGGRVAAWAKDAVEPKKSLTMTFKALVEAHKQLGDLPEPFAKRINMAAVGLEHLAAGDDDKWKWLPWDPTTGDRIEEARHALRSVIDGIKPLLKQIEREAAQSKKGNPTNHAAYSVANGVARIYFVGLGNIPTLGRDPITHLANGLFASTARAVFKNLHIKVGDVHDPCRQAISSITDDEIETLEILRCPVLRLEIGAVWDAGQMGQITAQR